MKRLAFLLGLYSIGAQVLLLRELISSFNGDELFIGTALFGWLLAVAVGAWLGGRTEKAMPPSFLFATGALILPLSMIAIRFSPLLVVDVIGESIPFTTAAMLSILLMLPVSLVSGWLFSLLTRFGWETRSAIVQVYLWEGIGAFAGGLAITLAVGNLISGLTAAAMIAVIVTSLSKRAYQRSSLILMSTIGAVLLAAATIGMPSLDRYLDSVKYSPYDVVDSFDTPYGHQALLTSDSMLVLVTDNLVEASYPGRENAENLVIPPLLYRPNAEEILMIGRAEFGVSQLVDSLPGVHLTMIDPRSSLSSRMSHLIPSATEVDRIEDDVIAYFTNTDLADRYDMIIFNTGPLDNYHTGNLLTPATLDVLAAHLNANGILACALPYDSERYVSPSARVAIGTVLSAFQATFQRVSIWPGAETILLGTDELDLTPNLDTLTARLSSLPLQPQFLDGSRLRDRLETFKMERVAGLLHTGSNVSSVERPLTLLHYVAWKSQTGGLESLIAGLVIRQSLVVTVIPILILLFFAWSLRGRQDRFALFLYFSAGILSLSLELLSFYLYQALAGSLYAEIAILIGAFMLGLAFGAYNSSRVSGRSLDSPALLLLALVCLSLLLTYDKVPHPVLLLYHISFLFAAATGTGALFVAATERYYLLLPSRNRGSGYACELLGSAAGALLSVTLLLPLLGLHWLLVAICALILLGLAGSTITGRI